MSTLIQVHFKTAGPFGEQMSRDYQQLAESINHEPGFMWKIWTENEAEGEAGGIYCFSDESAARAYMEMHRQRLAQFGITEVHSRYFNINAPLTALNRGPLLL